MNNENPNLTLSAAEKRRSERVRRSDALFWRIRDVGEYDMGWLLEASDEGLAFAWRGSVLPSEGSIIDVQMCPPGTWKSGIAEVRRVEIVHDDLVVIGVEHVSRTPPKPHAQAAEVKPIAKPLIARSLIAGRVAAAAIPMTVI